MTDQERNANKPLPSSYEAEENTSASVDAPASMTVSLPASEALKAMLGAMNGALQEIRGDIANIKSELSSIKEYISVKDQDLRRWQEGYDWAKRKELLGEFANWQDVLLIREQSENRQGRTAAAKVLREFRETMELSMENFSLEVIRPQINDDIEMWSGRIKVISAVPTDDKQLDGKIELVERIGMLYRTGQGDEGIIVTRLAHVNAWRYTSSIEWASISTPLITHCISI